MKKAIKIKSFGLPLERFELKTMELKNTVGKGSVCGTTDIGYSCYHTNDCANCDKGVSCCNATIGSGTCQNQTPCQ